MGWVGGLVGRSPGRMSLGMPCSLVLWSRVPRGHVGPENFIEHDATRYCADPPTEPIR